MNSQIKRNYNKVINLMKDRPEPFSFVPVVVVKSDPIF